jgi:L-rhamnose-H+ transport protein
LIVVLLGGFTTNFIWCAILNIKNRTWHEYYTTKKNSPPSREDETIIETAIDAPSEEMAVGAPVKASANTAERVPLLANYLFSAVAGVTWYLQFFFYSMGQMRMGKYEFSSWTLHMASIIIFSSLWGIALKEWRGSSSGTKNKLTLGLAMLVLSTIIVGYGNYLGAKAAP